MKISSFIDKISWSMADKALYVGYGLVQILQMNRMTTSEFGLFALLISIHTWIFVISDAVALQNIIQFGMNKNNEARANMFSLLLHLTIVIGLPMYIFIMKEPLSIIFGIKQLNYIFTMLPIFCLASFVRTYCIKFVFKHSKMNHLFFINLMLFAPITILTFYYRHTDGMLNLERMIYMYFSGHILSSIIAFFLTKRNIRISWEGKLSLKEVLNFSLPLLLTNALHSLPKQLDSYLVSYFFGTSATGIYYSAKTLFRVFEETLSAVQGLIYPAAVRYVERNDRDGLKIVMTKAVSFLFFAFLFIVIILQSGFSEFIITKFLSSKFSDAIGQFNLLSIAALGLPFYLFTSLIVAERKPKLLSKYVIYCVIAFIISFVIIGIIGNPSYIPFTYIVYSYSLALAGAYYFYKNYNYNVTDFFRIMLDLKHLLFKFHIKSK